MTKNLVETYKTLTEPTQNRRLLGIPLVSRKPLGYNGIFLSVLHFFLSYNANEGHPPEYINRSANFICNIKYGDFQK